MLVSLVSAIHVTMLWAKDLSLGSYLFIHCWGCESNAFMAVPSPCDSHLAVGYSHLLALWLRAPLCSALGSNDDNFVGRIDVLPESTLIVFLGRLTYVLRNFLSFLSFLSIHSSQQSCRGRPSNVFRMFGCRWDLAHPYPNFHGGG